MSGSPRSDIIESRFSTPVNDLDDHRFQPEFLPRAESMVEHNSSRRNSRRSRRNTADGIPAPTLTPQVLFHGTIARDFEHEQAIVDDDADDVESVAGRDRPRRGSTGSPEMTRQNKFMRERGDGAESAVTSRSSSPPNSVDAFAGPRRRPRAGTAGTLNSVTPSFRTLQHAPSNISFQRRRTFSEERPEAGIADPLHDSSVEDDICYPPSEEPRAQFEIDFEDLEEFVARKPASTPYIHPFGDRRGSAAQAQRIKIFQDLRKKTSAQSLHKLTTLHIPPPGVDGPTSDVDISTDDTNEKIDMSAFDQQSPAPAAQEKVNRWSFFSSRVEECIHAPELGDLLMPGETFQHLFELPSDGGVWWLDMLMPSEEEVEAICKAFHVHGLTREDIITQETREKVELFKSYYFVCFRSFYQMDKTSEYYMEPVNVYGVVFREGILTFTFCPSPHAANVRKRMGKLRDFVALGSDWICYALIDDIVDSFQPVIRQVEHESEGIEDDIFTARAEDSRVVLRQIGECRRKVMSLIRLLGGKADVIKGFAKRCNEQYSIAPRQDVGMYLSDIQDHVVTMMSNLGHFEKILSRSHANYLAQISVDGIAQGNRANEALSKVTFIATILVPLNLICGLFGMNVAVPGRDDGGLGWFFGIVGVMLFIVVTSVLIAKKKKII